MKRLELLKHLLSHGCVILREGGNHTAIYNPANKRQSVLGRHREIDNLMAVPFAGSWIFRLSNAAFRIA